MTRSVSLLFGVHAHQPVGNFPQVIDDALLRSYRPFIRTLYRFPAFLFSIHFSGWLLDYLSSHYPADIELLQEMVSRGQVELFGAGETEPVLAVIPDKDRRAQLDSLSDKLEKKFGSRPHGAWLTERVWESTVIPALHDCGIDYVAVDDYHFLCSGKEQRELNGFFTTEEDGKRLDLFPISEALRYRIPFTPAAETIRHLENMAEDRIPAAAIYFDDIEKFGIWPETYHWVYEQGWLEAFVQGVLASPLILPRHFKEYHAQASTRGVVYLPTTSYIEMNEWTLPPARAAEYAALVNHAKTAGVFDRDKSFLRGGIWKNFFSRSFFSMVKTNMLQLRSLRKLIHKSNSGENIQFVFVSKWMKLICELDTFTKVKKASIIPNPIDVKIFNYNPKNLEQRKRILMIRPFHTKKYATDIAIAAIIKLSALPFFKDLHFTIIGKGKMYDKQIKPIKHFSNIVFINRFLTQQEIKMYHDEHGVFLCPTRQDAQGVSMCEAMSSGLIPITSNNTAIPEFVTNNISGFLTLNSAGICDRISFLYNNANSFFKMSENSSANIQSICSIESVITQELDIICKSAKK